MDKIMKEYSLSGIFHLTCFNEAERKVLIRIRKFIKGRSGYDFVFTAKDGINTDGWEGGFDLGRYDDSEFRNEYTYMPKQGVRMNW